MKYRAVVSFSPAHIFGVPDGDALVVPRKPNNEPTTVTSAPVDPASMKVVGGGTLSRYRQEGETLQLQAELDGITFTVKDNFVSFDFSNDDLTQWEQLETLMSRLVGHLTFTTNEPFSYQIVKLQEAEGRQTVLSRTDISVHGSIYDIPLRTAQLRTGFENSRVRDPTLEKSLLYFHHASHLLATPASFRQDLNQFLLFQGEAFLNYWKSAAAIIGDPTKGDHLRERGKRLGLGESYYQTNVQPLTDLRTDFDVAHYDVPMSRAKAASDAIPRMIEMAREVVDAYLGFLRRGGTGFSPGNP